MAQLTLPQLQEKLQPARIAIGQLQIQMNNSKVGSDNYIKAKTKFDAAKKLLNDY